jgi:HTH-type transcriptional regulator, transcriptional repressor of NAD biosynthesis genes
VTVLVCSLPDDPIPGELRFRWVQQMYPELRIVHVRDNLPQHPGEHPDFWQIWRRTMLEASPEGVDYFFASEDYGFMTAEVLGAQYVPVDRHRQLVAASGTMVRADPIKHWASLPDIVKPYFLKRVCIFGPESTGKSTLAAALAKHFETLHAAEYARPLLDPKGGRCDWDDITRIARGQAATEDALAQQANRVLICDTDVLTTVVWSEILFGSVPEQVRQMAEHRQYDLYLLLDVDVPWVSDGQRFFSSPQVRREIFIRFQQALESRCRPHLVICGTWDERYRVACQAVERLLEQHTPLGPGRMT